MTLLALLRPHHGHRWASWLGISIAIGGRLHVVVWGRQVR
jgi:hypothetical protein